MLMRLSPRLAILFSVGLVALGLTSTASAGDTTPPTKPGNFHLAGSTATTLSLDWNASTDNVGVTAYRVFRDGTLAATTTATQATLRDLTCSTVYIVMVSARDAAGNKSMPAVIFAKTKPCPLATPRCPTPETVLALLIEHKIEYGCGWPDGWAARQALSSIRAFLKGRKPMVAANWRALKWMNQSLAELDLATGNAGAWSSSGVLQPNQAGHTVLRRVGRAIRLLHYSNDQLFQVSKSEKWALTAASWYMVASEFNARYKAGILSPYVEGRARYHLTRADYDFFHGNTYSAWGQYRIAWELMTGVS
jgi:hypothetical protein